MADVRSTLARSPLFHDLPPAALDAVVADAAPFTFHPGHCLWYQGDPPLDLVVVQSGMLYEFQESRSGRRSTLYVKEPPDAVGDVAVFERRPHDASVAALTRSVVLAIRAHVVLDLAASSPQLTRNVVRGFAAHVRRLSQRRSDLVLLDLGRRVAKALLRVARPAEPPVVDIDVIALSHLAGGAVVSVTGALSRLERRGWIALDRGRVALLDLPALRHYGAGGSGTPPATPELATASARP